MNKVTIYILTYNRKNYLFECLNSIKNQTFKNFKVIVLDNCSDENYFEELISIYSNEFEIELIKHKSNIGAFRNFKFAWDMNLSTDFFMIFHDDDIMHPRLLETLISVHKSMSDLAWVASKMQGFKHRRIEFCKLSKIKGNRFNTEKLVENFILDGGIHFGSVLYNSSLKSNIILEDFYSQFSIIFDRPILINLSKIADTFIIDNELVLYRIHSNQDSVTGALNFDNIFNLYLYYSKELLKQSIFKKAYFKCWFLFQLIDSNYRLRSEYRKSIVHILKYSSSLKLFSYRHLISYPFMFFLFKIFNPIKTKIYRL